MLTRTSRARALAVTLFIPIAALLSHQTGCGPAGGLAGDGTGFGVFSPGGTVVAGTQVSAINDAISVTPSVVDFGSAQSTQTFTIANLTDEALTFKINGQADWLTFAPNSGEVAARGSVTITVNIYRSIILSGQVQAELSVETEVSSPLAITFKASAGDSTDAPAGGPLQVSVTSLDFASSITSRSFLVRNTAGGSLQYTASTDVPWITFVNGTGTSTGQYRSVRAKVNRAGLAAGNYIGTVTVSAGNEQRALPVQMAVAAGSSPNTPAAPQLEVSSSLLDFGASQRRLSFLVHNAGGGALAYGVTVNAPWAAATSAGGVSRGTYNVVSVQATRTNMAPGEYTGTATVTGDNGQTHEIALRMQVSGSASPPSRLVFSTDVLDLGTSSSSSTLTFHNAGSGTLQWTVSVDKDWVSVQPTEGYNSGENDTLTVTMNRSGLAPGYYDAAMTVASSDGAMQDIQVVATVVAGGAPAPLAPWHNTDQRLDVLSLLNESAVPNISPRWSGYPTFWWAEAPVIHSAMVSEFAPDSPAIYRAMIDGLLLARPDAQYGNYISGTCCRKLSQMNKYPPETIPYEAVPPEMFLGPYDEPSTRANINLQLPEARRLMADLIVQEALGRDTRGLFMDNMAHPDTGGTRATWPEVCDYMRSMRTRMNAAGMRLIINLACQPYWLAGQDAYLLSQAADGVNFEQPLHWSLVRPYPERVAGEIEVYRYWLDRGMNVALMAAETRIVLDETLRDAEARVLAGVVMMARRPGDSMCVPRSWHETPPDWLLWPQQFGAPLGDYTISSTSPVILTREFQNAIITVDLGKSMNAAQVSTAVNVQWRN